MKSKLLYEDKGLRTFAVVFDTGDDPREGLLKFAEENRVSGAQLTAIGAFSQVTLAFFDPERKEYVKTPIREQVEAVSFLGNLGTADGKPKLHAHLVVGKRDGSAYGGHFMGGKVRPTLEVILTETPVQLQRKMDATTGLPLIDLAA